MAVLRKIVAGWAKARTEPRPARRGGRIAAFFAEWYSALLAAAGWACLTAGVVLLTAPVAWLFSVGLALLLLVGLRPLGTVIIEGLDSLSARKPKSDA